jgi:hypothetical protein
MVQKHMYKSRETIPLKSRKNIKDGQYIMLYKKMYEANN